MPVSGESTAGAEQTPPEEDEEEAAGTIAAVIGSPRFWLAPLVLVLILMSLMAALYMGAVASPRENLHDFPIALVNADRGAEVDNPDGNGSTEQNFGDQVAAGIIDAARPNGFDVHRSDRTTALNELNAGKVYGVIVIGPNFSEHAVSLGRAAVLQAKPDAPSIDVFINRGSGTFASSVTTTFAQEIDKQVNSQFGERLTATVRQQLARADVPFSGAAQLALANPVNVAVVEPTPLPDGAGNGLSAFYFTLLLVLAGFTGAMMVSVIVDGFLGQTPVEYGPFYSLRKRLAISRWGTLAAKWTILLLVALLQSALFIAVCTAVGTSLPNSFLLWAFSVLVIFAVGVTASSVLAIFGNPGLLVNLIFFVILGLPSSGGTIPLEASPRLFSWIAAFEPMHVVYLGVRSILYFDADPGSGLARSIVQTLLGLILGALLGLAVTKLYDRKGWHRYPGGMTLPPRLAAAAGL
ncbi:hypothetical protein GS4_24_00370 [Gordonia soli NBRC 108243]|uniref:DUF3533 domain-containing protein n=1 Tax=Gordonia soli NBRC 108243 TaxID=1223545 RepID=M0QM94_9ACTN|nr:hypothetical protein GS4_24_00370 [Gordonia soli NBRC 108243]